MAAVKRSQKLLPCLTELKPAGSRMDPPQAKANPSAIVVPPLG